MDERESYEYGYRWARRRSITYGFALGLLGAIGVASLVGMGVPWWLGGLLLVAWMIVGSRISRRWTQQDVQHELLPEFRRRVKEGEDTGGQEDG